MTEAEWLACDEPQKMLEHLSGQRRYRRKLRLFACACCRHVWDLLEDVRSRNAVEVVEGYVERKAKKTDAEQATKQAHDAISAKLTKQAEGDTSKALRLQIESADVVWRAVDLSQSLADSVRIIVIRTCPAGGLGKRGCDHLSLIREIFGVPRPFPQRKADKEWLSWNGGLVRRLAQAAYIDRLLPGGHLDANALAVLSDALEDAGCSDDAILSHLRSPGPHVRGCWAIDLILGKV